MEKNKSTFGLGEKVAEDPVRWAEEQNPDLEFFSVGIVFCEI